MGDKKLVVFPGQKRKEETRDWYKNAMLNDALAREEWGERFPAPSRPELRDWSAFEELPEKPGVISRKRIREIAQEEHDAPELYELHEFNLPRFKAEEAPEMCAIGCAAFAESSIRQIVIPEGVQVIGPVAFYGCRELRGVVFPRSLVAISDDAFENCGHLAMPDFSACRKLESIGDRAFASASSRKFVNLRLPRRLKRIGLYAFRGCSNLESVRFNRRLESLGYGAFNACISLEEVKGLPARRMKLAQEIDERKATSTCTTLDIALSLRFRNTVFAKRRKFNDYGYYYLEKELEKQEYPF